ncbi:MAG: TIGR03435 family protein [Acidobacteriaceae bacterium]|jgi:uncharacterized protein (TIGR03435 family)
MGILRAITILVVVGAAVTSGLAQNRGATAGSPDPPAGLLDSGEAQHALPPGLKFDVVSARLDTSGVDHASMQSPQNGDGITIENLTLEWVIDYAYDFQRTELVSGLPEWAKTEKYDITAKVDGADVAAFGKLNQDQRRVMLQAVLEDQFKLKVHRAPMEIPVFALVVGKNGPKMKQAKPGDTYAGGLKFPNGAAAGGDILLPNGPGHFVGQGVSMQALALMLTRIQLGRQVVDRTGLTGKYDFTLRFAPTDAMRPVINGTMQGVPADQSDDPEIFTALQEQLGLRLVPAKAPVEGLVIDHVERPSQN